jgi:CheY-like chemotaxis protein
MHRILVVDDENLVADTLGLIFRKHGFDTKVAYSADGAIACARDFQPDLLVCDVTMPIRTGIELMDDFRRELPDCHVIVLTGYYSNLIRVREQSDKMPRPTRVLTKPCDPTLLLREAGQMLAMA